MGVEAKIKQYISSNGIPQKELSKKTKITTAKLCLALNEKRRLTFSEYETICWALGVPVDSFLAPRAPEQAS